jgi:glyoxylase-like metal-dependent hydrolase (beta-lactamase superfamily II)
MDSIPTRMPGAGVLAVALCLCGVLMVRPESANAQPIPEEVAEGVFWLKGLGANVLAITGAEGVILVDNGHSRNVESLTAQVAALESGAVRFAINTHFHFDHVGASQSLGEAGAILIGHRNTRERMMEEWVVPEWSDFRYAPVPPYPETALPTITLDGDLTLHVDWGRMQLLHYPLAHSNADVAVFLRDANVLHTGDLYLSNGFPILDSFHGGTIDGLLAALGELVQLIDDQTIVISGHGPASDRAGLEAYRTMLSAGRDRIAELMSQGLTLEEIVEADPTAGLYAGERSWLDPRLFVWSVYVDLSLETH